MLSDSFAAVPALAPGMLLATVDAETLLLEVQTRRIVLRGAALAALADAIDGRKCVGEIVEQLSEQMSAAEALYLLDRLESGGYVGQAQLVESAVLDASSPAVATDTPEMATSKHSAALATEVSLRVESQLLASADVEAALAFAGVAVVPSAKLLLLVTDDYLSVPGIAVCQEFAGPILVVQLAPEQELVGPVLNLGGPCWSCLEHALLWNNPVRNFIRREVLPSRVAPYAALSSRIINLSLAIAPIAQAVLAGSYSKANSVLSLATKSAPQREHHVRKRPQCAQCGDASWMTRQAEQAPLFTSVPIVSREDGGFRSRSPAQTLAAFEHLISPLTGVVNYLHPMPGRHEGCRQVYVAGFQVCPISLGSGNNFDKICAGKGQSAEQAQASALCETLERASSVWQGDEALSMASQRQLQQRTLGFDALLGFSANQRRERDKINSLSADPRRWVTQAYQPDQEVGWTPAWSLTRKERCWVPASYCFAETPRSLGSDFGIYNPNGTAAGNCREEAVIQGLFELVERDATAIWWYNQLKRPAVELEALNDPFVNRLRSEYNARGWKVDVLDLTHDLGFGVYAAVARHAQNDRYALGFGCHLEPKIGVTRALTELNQLLDERPSAPHPWDRTLLPEPDFLRAAGEVRVAEAPAGGLDLREELLRCVALLARRDLEVLVVDKSRPDLGISVVQVIVPGLRHFWPRFGPGRLYDVPVALGWREKATREADLNPAPLFL